MRTLYIISLLVVVGCINKGEIYEHNLHLSDTLFNKHPDFTEIDIPVGEDRPLLLEDIASNISFIPLESKQEAFLKKTDDLFVGDSLILINTRGNIKYFNRNGDFIFTFEKLGRGPSEYTTIFGLAVDFAGNKMAIADHRFVKLYDLTGNLIKALKLPGPPFLLTPNIAFLDSAHLLLENDRIKPYYKEGYSPLWSINIDNNESAPLFRNYPDSVYRFRRKFSFIGNLIQTENSIHYRSVDSYNVYAIDNSRNVSLRYRLNFGDKAMPLGALYDVDNYDKYTERFAVIYNIFETEGYRFIKYAFNTGSRNVVVSYAIYSKREKKVVTHQSDAAGFISIHYPNLTFWPSTVDDRGRLICIHPAWDFTNGDILKGIEKEDNIILSVITMK